MSGEPVHPEEFISKLMENESFTYEQAIDKIETMLERGLIYLNSQGYVERIMASQNKEIKNQLGYSRIGRNNV